MRLIRFFRSVLCFLLLSAAMADHTGFEPVVSSVTGKHVRPLHQWSNSCKARYILSKSKRKKSSVIFSFYEFKKIGLSSENLKEKIALFSKANFWLK